MQLEEPKTWKNCSICKKALPFSTLYYLCSVSTCRHKRKGYRFCTVACWDAHLGFANHRESWAEEARTPTKEEYMQELALEDGSAEVRAPVRKIIDNSSPSSTAMTSTNKGQAASNIKTETLVVVSKVKQLIKDQSDMSTSQCGIDALTKKVVQECLSAIANAKLAGRKTVMGRDVK